MSPPASEAEVTHAEHTLGVRFSPGYRSFLLSSDGYGGPVGADGRDVYLWPVAEVADCGYERPAEAGIVLIGSNGGPTGFGFLVAEPAQFVSVPLASSDRDEIRVLGSSFDEFLQAIADGEGW